MRGQGMCWQGLSVHAVAWRCMLVAVLLIWVLEMAPIVCWLSRRGWQACPWVQV